MLGDGIYKIRKVLHGKEQLDRLLQEAVLEARAEKVTWAQIGRLLGLTTAEARAKFGPRRAGSSR